jgi:hypothetical protein
VQTDGTLATPNGAVLRHGPRSAPASSSVSKLRDLLAAYDEGAGDDFVAYALFRDQIVHAVDMLQENPEVISFTTGTESRNAPPPRTMRVEITIDALSIVMRRI